MAIQYTAEDGSGKPDATAYEVIAFIDQYHENNGNTFWATLGTAAKQTAANRATKYIDKRFKDSFVGVRMIMDQALAWPRIGAYDADDYPLNGVPIQLKWAFAEYALRAAIYMTLAPDPLRPVPTQDMTQTPPTQDTEFVTGQVKSKRVTVGPISESVSYESLQDVLAKNTAAGTREAQSVVVNDFNIPEYPEADLLIEGLLKDRSFSVELRRGN